MSTQTAQSGQGGLPPLEYSDCFLDSPTFREVIVLYEKEMENNYYLVKNLVRQCDSMIQATREFSKMQQTFAQHLGSFKFQTIGEQSEDEKMISNSLQTFARLLMSIEDCRHNMLSTISVRLLQTLENFRKEQIQKTREDKKRFDQATKTYYDALQKHLGTSVKKKDQFEVNSAVEVEHAKYRQVAFEYVCNLQDVHAQKQYEIIEPIIGYVNDMSTFLHQAYDEAASTKQELQSVQFKVQILRETHENELEKAYQLKAKIIDEGEAGLLHHPEFLRQGHVYVQDSSRKVALHSWHRYFCQFRKKDIANKKVKQVRFYPIGHQGLIPSQDFMEVKNCVRCKTVEVDRRFCFEVELMTHNGIRKYLIQALSEEDRKSWLEIMEGKEPVYSSLKVIELTAVNEQGCEFIRRCIDEIESRGLDEEGLYRKPGIVSKATKLYKDAIEKKGKLNSINLSNEEEFDTKTIASAVKGYLSKQLEEPLMTFALHSQFIDCAKIGDREKRLEVIKELVDQLPEINRRILVLLIEHLYNISQQSSVNLMKASNLGVVFGPTLMRAEMETVATIVDIKYQNIIVQEMIEQKDRILYDGPASHGPPSIPPPRPPGGGGDKRFSNKRNSDPPTSRPPNPPTLGNPNIPPPPITCYSNKSPEPHQYEVPTTSGGSKLEASDSIRRKPPPIPKSKPLISETQKRMSAGSPPDTPSNHTKKPRRQSTGPSGKITASAPKSNRGLPIRPPRKNRGPSARALYDCAAEDDQELSFFKGEILYNVEESAEEPQWLTASKVDGKRGLVPSNYVEMLP